MHVHHEPQDYTKDNDWTYLRSHQTTLSSLWTALRCTFKLGVKYVYHKQYNSQISSWLQDASGSQVDTLDKKNKPSIQDKVSGNHMQQFIVRDITLNCDIINHNYNKVGKER